MWRGLIEVCVVGRDLALDGVHRVFQVIEVDANPGQKFAIAIDTVALREIAPAIAGATTADFDSVAAIARDHIEIRSTRAADTGAAGGVNMDAIDAVAHRQIAGDGRVHAD